MMALEKALPYSQTCKEQKKDYQIISNRFAVPASEKKGTDTYSALLQCIYYC